MQDGFSFKRRDSTVTKHQKRVKGRANVHLKHSDLKTCVQIKILLLHQHDIQAKYRQLW